MVHGQLRIGIVLVITIRVIGASKTKALVGDFRRGSSHEVDDHEDSEGDQRGDEEASHQRVSNEALEELDDDVEDEFNNREGAFHWDAPYGGECDLISL